MSVPSLSFTLAISSWLLVSQYHFEVVEMNEGRIVRRRSSDPRRRRGMGGQLRNNLASPVGGSVQDT